MLVPNATRCGSFIIQAGQHISTQLDGTNAKRGELAGTANGRTRIVALGIRAFGSTARKLLLRVYRGTLTGPKHLIFPGLFIPKITINEEELVFPFFTSFETQIRLFGTDWYLWYQLSANPETDIEIVEEAVDWQ